MRLFKPVLTLALSLCLAACAPQNTAPKRYTDNAALEADAQAGDSWAAYLLGTSACTDEPAANNGRQALKWLARAANSHDQQIVGLAHQGLANFYLARFKYYNGPTEEWTYDPRKVKGKELKFCTGSHRSAANDARAETHLKICAEKPFMAQTVCRENLGKLYYEQKKWAKAYKEFAVLSAWHENGSYGYGEFFDGRLSNLPPSDRDPLNLDWKRVKPLMQEAAKHLSRAETDRIDNKTRREVRAANWRYFRNDARGKVNK